ncbi:MAG: hypothetical protein A4S14_02725 [Proteobacteria bacterium SG_bin9]|nr:MAG: hypothetical protein A4S14_02725 [Proteobacteria bacterium SG_bin9]
MYRYLAIAFAGLSLGGCSSFSSFEIFKPAPQTVNLQLESVPPGADATTGSGPGCKTPCSVAVPVPSSTDSLTVTFTLNKFLPATVPVQIVRQPGDFAGPPVIVADPNPVVVELQPAKPVKRQPAKRPARRAAPQAAVSPPPGGSPFPNPSR